MFSFVTRPTIAAGIEINDAANANIDHPQKALILLLELFLVEDLDGEYAFLVHAPVEVSVSTSILPRSMCNIHVEALIPVWIERLLDHSRRPRLLATDGRDSKGIGESCISL